MTNWSGYAHRVRFSEVDPQSIVFNSRYLEFFDAASIEFFRFFGYPPDLMQTAGLEPVAAAVVFDINPLIGAAAAALVMVLAIELVH